MVLPRCSHGALPRVVYMTNTTMANTTGTARLKQKQVIIHKDDNADEHPSTQNIKQ